MVLDREATERYLNLPSIVNSSLEADIRKATYTLINFTSDNAIEGSDRIPKHLLRKAKGLVFLTIIKAGMFFSGRFGTGLVITRLPDGEWSAPSALYLSGVGCGLQFGGEVADVVIVLRTKSAVRTFCNSTQVSLGTELGISIGPVGRSAETDMHVGKSGAAPAYSCKRNCVQ